MTPGQQRVARMAHHTLTATVAALVGLVVIAVLGAAGLAWRLSDGPLDITGLVQHLARTAAPGVTAGSVTLSLAREGNGHVLRVDAADLARSEAGQPAQSVRSATATLAVAPMLIGRAVPETLVLDGLRLRIVQAGGAANQPARPKDQRREAERLLSSLRRVSVTDAQVEFAPSGGGQPVRLTGAADFTRDADGTLSGQATIDAVAGDTTARLQATGSYAATAGAQLQATLTPISPATLAQAIPSLGGVAALDAPVALQLDAALTPALDLRHASVHAQAGPGTVALPANGGGTSTGHFTAASLDADGTANAATLTALRVVLSPASGNPPSTIVLSGAAQRATGRLKAALVLDLDHAAFADLASLWPERVGGNARGWLTENMTAGTARDGHFTMGLEAAETGDDLTLTTAGGTMVADDVTVWWLRPVPPVQHAHGLLTWLAPDVTSIAVSDGRQGGVAISNGSVRISGLTAPHQSAAIEMDLAGPLPDVAAVLKQPRLNLLSKHPVPLEKPAGAMTAHLSVQLPLESKVSVDQVVIHAKGQVANVHLGRIAAGRDLDQGQLAFDVTNDGLSINGPAQFGHIPSTLALQMDFKAGPPSQVLQHVNLAMTLTPQDAAAAGLQALGLQSGVVPATLDYAERRDATAVLQMNADLKDAAFISPFGWSKAAGPGGSAEGRALLDHGRIVGLDGLHAEAPGLSIVARSEMAGGNPSVVHIERGEIGRTSATGVVTLPQKDGDAYKVTLAGPQLDLEGRLTSQQAPAAPENEAKAPAQQSSTPYAIDLKFDRVIFGKDRSLSAVTVVANGNGRHMVSGRLITGPPARLRVEEVTSGAERKLTATAADVGELLKSVDLATEIDGGSLSLEGSFDDRQPDSPFSGSLDLRKFKVRGAPMTAKVLQGMTLYGLVDALDGPGLSFDRLITQLRLRGPVLGVEDARAYSSSLGLTANGQFDFGRKTVDMHGTIVPAYFFNSLLGRVPVLGRIFSPEKGSGLFAANFSMTGKLASPSVSVNPLSALTPGFTRRFFDLFD